MTFLGVETSQVPSVVSEQLGLAKGFGLVVDYVVPDSPSAAAGIQQNDILKMLNDQILIEPSQLRKLLQNFSEGTEVTLTILRKGQEQKITVKLTKKEVPQRHSWMPGGKPGPQVQGRSLLPLFAGKRAGWRKSFLIEYWAENAMPWLVGMTYKAVRTDRYKYIRWVNRARDGELDELYDLDSDPYEVANVIRRPAYRATRDKLRRELRALVADALGL